MKYIGRRACALLVACLSLTAHADDKLIAITFYVDHPSSAALLKGVMDGLHDEGIDESHGYRFDLQGAQGNPVTAAQIAQKFAAEEPAIVVALSSASAQAILSRITHIPVVFAGITDPVSAKLVKDMQHPGGNATGTKDSPSLTDLLALIRQVKPQAKRIGVIYNPGDSGSTSQVTELRRLLPGTGLSLVESTVTRAVDVQAAAQSLAGKADVIFCPNDIMVASSFAILAHVQLEQKIPVVVTATDFVKAGALAAVGSSFYEGGRSAAVLVQKIIVGKQNPGNLPVVLPAKTIVTVNRKTADALNIHFAPEFLAKAEQVDYTK
jgi:putative tryptophan/tyrosine transport system substrate-binding protein